MVIFWTFPSQWLRHSAGVIKCLYGNDVTVAARHFLPRRSVQSSYNLQQHFWINPDNNYTVKTLRMTIANEDWQVQVLSTTSAISKQHTYCAIIKSCSTIIVKEIAYVSVFLLSNVLYLYVVMHCGCLPGIAPHVQ